jgi:hypothetical protein
VEEDLEDDDDGGGAADFKGLLGFASIEGGTGGTAGGGGGGIESGGGGDDADSDNEAAAVLQVTPLKGGAVAQLRRSGDLQPSLIPQMVTVPRSPPPAGKHG